MTLRFNGSLRTDRVYAFLEILGSAKISRIVEMFHVKQFGFPSVVCFT